MNNLDLDGSIAIGKPTEKVVNKASRDSREFASHAIRPEHSESL